MFHLFAHAARIDFERDYVECPEGCAGSYVWKHRDGIVGKFLGDKQVRCPRGCVGGLIPVDYPESA